MRCCEPRVCNEYLGKRKYCQRVATHFVHSDDRLWPARTKMPSGGWKCAEHAEGWPVSTLVQIH